MFYVKIKTPGWETFSGDHCGIQFHNGVTVDAVTRRIADRMAALQVVEIINLDGVSQGQGGEASRMVERYSLQTFVREPMPRMTDEEAAAEQKKAFDDAGKPAAKTFYTKDQLTIIAEKEGIAGLRVIAGPWNVKDRSIPKLIELIVKAQNHFVKMKQERIEEVRRTKAAAGDAAIQAQLDEEARLLAGARVLTSTDETPNAVDEAGNPIYIAPAPAAAPPKNEFVPADGPDPKLSEKEIAHLKGEEGEYVPDSVKGDTAEMLAAGVEHSQESENA